MTHDRAHATWSDFGDAINSLAAQIDRSGYEPDCILAVIRGGLAVAAALSYRLGIKDVQTVNVEYYSGSGLDDVQLAEPQLLPPGLELEQLVGKRVLLVDDVSDSGTTLTFLSGLISTVVTEQRSAVWFCKPHSTVRPDFVAQKTDRWIVFPWSPFSTEAAAL